MSAFFPHGTYSNCMNINLQFLTMRGPQSRSPHPCITGPCGPCDLDSLGSVGNTWPQPSEETLQIPTSTINHNKPSTKPLNYPKWVQPVVGSLVCLACCSQKINKVLRTVNYQMNPNDISACAGWKDLQLSSIVHSLVCPVGWLTKTHCCDSSSQNWEKFAPRVALPNPSESHFPRTNMHSPFGYMLVTWV